MDSPFRQLVLEAVARHDGQWTVQHLERALGPIHPDLPGSLRAILATLEQEQLLTRSRKDLRGLAPYKLTPRGRKLAG